MRKILFIFGTRPEAIKMIPIYNCFMRDSSFNAKICITAQHREMLDNVMDFFEVCADYDLNIMKPNQTLEELTANLLVEISAILLECRPNLVFVHGDTTTSFVASLSAFYQKIDVAHIEAGLRTYSKYSPFPEETNRQLTSKIAKYHFAPTVMAKKNLIKENINKNNIFVVGNSVIDALFLTLEKIKNKKFKLPYNPTNKKKYILITGHRRENFGEGFFYICSAIKKLSVKYKNIDFVYPVHLNPNVQKPVSKILSNIDNVYLIPPLRYEEFVHLMLQSYIILTDSGGIQEEAPSLGKPVLVMREYTERSEALSVGTVKLIGTKNIEREVSLLLEDENEYKRFSKNKNPYGDGTSSEKILNFIKSINI